MQRRKFLTSTLVASTLGPSATDSLAGPSKRTPPKKAFTVKAGETRFGERMPFQGVNPNDLKVSAKDTNGMLTVFEYVGKQKVGPPLHLHFDQDEIFYVIEGEYLFQVGQDKLTAKAGDTIFGPRNIPHTWIQLSNAGKLMYLLQPAGTMEEFFSAINQLKGPPTAEQMQKIHQEHGMNVLGPPLSIK